ncbi:virulence RhuM family protein [Marinomonas sp. M1K-6]|uniref:Virulence RhuM family protein n=1 Tax=Marinomonas profundi TaxID=2726122 RepID=A0A847R3L1_9GAMM|nr:RhuM family protein [Marinomonas profundi]NLQ18525.1 virulence RhuM family protein [Marinomonas profundi]UDV04398.1 virulence RhuM family protein [Marinomonas profundi]
MHNDIVIYENDRQQIEVRLDSEQETIWLTQAQMAILLDTSSDNISLHLKNIFNEDELEESSTTEEYSVVRQEGKRNVARRIKHYNLDAIISVGYRVNSKKGTQFRIWATQRLKEHLVQGYTINQQRFEQNAQELQQAIALIQKTAKSPDLTAEAGSGLVDIVSINLIGGRI